MRTEDAKPCSVFVEIVVYERIAIVCIFTPLQRQQLATTAAAPSLTYYHTGIVHTAINHLTLLSYYYL